MMTPLAIPSATLEYMAIILVSQNVTQHATYRKAETNENGDAEDDSKRHEYCVQVNNWKLLRYEHVIERVPLEELLDAQAIVLADKHLHCR